MSTITKEQLLRYADVICAWQAGNPVEEIALAFNLPADLVSIWVVNFLDLDRRAA